MKNIKTMHGINIGLRYKVTDASSFELSWENLGTDVLAFGERDNGSFEETEIFYTFNQYFLSYQSYFGDIGLGSSIGYNNVKIQERLNAERRSTLDIPNQWVARINLSYNFGASDKVSLSLQPFVQIPITSVDLSSLSSNFGIDPLQDNDETFLTYGLTLVFYNGRQ